MEGPFILLSWQEVILTVIDELKPFAYTLLAAYVARQLLFVLVSLRRTSKN